MAVSFRTAWTKWMRCSWSKGGHPWGDLASSSPQKNIWQRLETFLVVMPGGRIGSLLLLSAGRGQGCCWVSCIAQDEHAQQGINRSKMSFMPKLGKPILGSLTLRMVLPDPSAWLFLLCFGLNSFDHSVRITLLVTDELLLVLLIIISYDKTLILPGCRCSCVFVCVFVCVCVCVCVCVENRLRQCFVLMEQTTWVLFKTG